MTQRDSDDAWWTKSGIKDRWDDDRETSSPRVIMAKAIREGVIPFLIATVSAGFVCFVGYSMEVSIVEIFTITLSVFGGVFLFFYKIAGFQDSVLRDA